LSDSSEGELSSEAIKFAIALEGRLGERPGGKSTQANFLPHHLFGFYHAIVIEAYGIRWITLIANVVNSLYRGIIISIKAPRTFGVALGCWI